MGVIPPADKCALQFCEIVSLKPRDGCLVCSCPSSSHLMQQALARVGYKVHNPKNPSLAHLERQLREFYVQVSLLSVCLSLSPTLALSVCLSVCLSLSLSLCLSLCLSVSLSLCLSVSLSLCLALCLARSLSLFLPPSLSPSLERHAGAQANCQYSHQPQLACRGHKRPLSMASTPTTSCTTFSDLATERYKTCTHVVLSVAAGV